MRASLEQRSLIKEISCDIFLCDRTGAGGLIRSFDCAFIESVIKHPDVIKGARAWAEIDIQSIVDNLDNYLLVNEFGGFLVISRMPGVYECHTQFLKEGRGGLVRLSVTEAFDYMFINTDCTKIVTKAYKDNPASVALSRAFFKEEGETESYYYFSHSLYNWANNEVNALEGEGFHELVKDTTNHENDSTHDYHVGMCLRMAKAGNYLKAQHYYNEWAVMSGYETITILRNNPLVVKIGSMTLEIGEEVRLCQ